MNDQQRVWNEQRQAMLHDVQERIRYQLQYIEDIHENIAAAQQAKDRFSEQHSLQELEEAKVELAEMRKELDQLDESVCF